MLTKGHILGLTGYKKSGKDTVAKIIADLVKPHTCKRYGFADALKKEVAKACGVTVQDIEDNKDLYRPILQWWGTEFRRNQNIEYWTGKLLATLHNETELPHIVIVADVRFLNEAKLVHELGGKIFYVRRQESEDKHKSETEQRFIHNDGLIDNTKSIEMLKMEVETTLKQYGII